MNREWVVTLKISFKDCLKGRERIVIDNKTDILVESKKANKITVIIMYSSAKNNKTSFGTNMSSQNNIRLFTKERFVMMFNLFQ
jgi:hypothetical protein